jgi:hypothetical protein
MFLLFCYILQIEGGTKTKEKPSFTKKRLKVVPAYKKQLPDDKNSNKECPLKNDS